MPKKTTTTRRTVAKSASRKIRKEVPAGPGYAEIGSSGLRRQGGLVYEEPLRELQGQKGVAAYREMSLNDDVVGAILNTFRLIVRRVNWKDEPGIAGNAESEAHAQFVKECREDMSHSWDDHVSEVLTKMTFGWAYFEVVAKRRAGPDRDPGSRFTDGRIGLRKIAIRSQESLEGWMFDPNGGIQGMRQRDPYSAKPVATIPIENALLFRTTTEKNNPEGRSMLRNAYIAYFRKKQAAMAEAIAIDRDATGIAVAWVPAEVVSATPTTAQAATKSAMEAIVQNLRVDEQAGIVFPLAYDENGNKAYDLTLLKADGVRQIDVNATISRHDRAIAMSMLYDMLTLGANDKGSYALAKTKSEMTMLAIESIIESMEEVWNRILIPRLFLWNGMKVDVLPRISHDPVKETDMVGLATYVKELVGAGAITPDPNLEDHLRVQGKLPEREEGFYPPAATLPPKEPAE